MRTICLFVLSGAIAMSANAQTAKQLRVHKKAVAESTLMKTAVLSLDTLYCSGKRMAVSKLVLPSGTSDEMTKNTFADPVSGTNLLSISFAPGADNPAAVVYSLEFHPLNLKCEFRPSKPVSGPAQIVCDYGLINAVGLDTLKSELFYTVHGKKHGSGSAASFTPPEKSLLVSRDTTAPVMVENENISQGGVLIGSFELDSLEGPGGLLKQYTIFNAVGAQVCTCTCTDPLKGYWSFLIYRDKRFHTATLKKGNDLEEIIRHLSRRGVL